MTTKLKNDKMLSETKQKGSEIVRKKFHEPYMRLKGILREKGLTYADIAETLEISETAVGFKINGTSDFFIGEVDTLEEKHGIPTEIFFKKKLRI